MADTVGGALGELEARSRKLTIKLDGTEATCTVSDRGLIDELRTDLLIYRAVLDRRLTHSALTYTSPGDSGGEGVQVTLGRAEPSQADRAHSTARRLTDLERR